MSLRLFVHLFENAYQDLLYRRNEKSLVFSLNQRVLQLNSLIDTGIEIARLMQGASPERLALERAAVLTNAAREGARIGVLPGYSIPDVQARVQTYLTASGLTASVPPVCGSVPDCATCPCPCAQTMESTVALMTRPGYVFSVNSAGLPVAAQPAPPKRIQQVMDRPEFAHAIWGMEFYDLQSKKTVYAINRDRLFVPGSTTKLLTTGTAFATLGPSHQFRTRIYRTGPVRDGIVQGDLVLLASGDPDLTRWEHPNGEYAFADLDHSYGGPPLPVDPLAPLRALASQIVSRGIRGATGQVLVDASLFREGTRDLGTRLVISALNVNDNVVDIVVTPGARAGDPVDVKVSPRTAYLTVQANLTTVDSGTPAQVRTVEDSTDKDHRVLVGVGRVPVGPAMNVRWAVPAPSRFGEIVLAEVLNDAGIRVIPRLGSRTVDFGALASVYADSMIVAEHVSLPFAAAARVILKTSQNLHASSMPFLLGAQPAAPVAYGYLKDLIQTSSEAGLPYAISYPDKRQIAPRFGFAWRPVRDTTVLRGGYGVFYERVEGNFIFSAINNPPFISQQDIYDGNIESPTGGTTRLFPAGLSNSHFMDMKVPRVMNWSFGLQQNVGKDRNGRLPFHNALREIQFSDQLSLANCEFHWNRSPRLYLFFRKKISTRTVFVGAVQMLNFP